MRLIFSFFCLWFSLGICAQTDTIPLKKLDFTSDFRFRIEHDWNGLNVDGSELADRSRLRYRFRFGLNYSLDKNSSFGARIRSGRLDDQQGPHVTLGGNNGEFGLVSIGLEKLYYQFETKGLKVWIGKNTLPLKKLNELFWNDNVYPEGLGLKYLICKNEEGLLNKLGINVGHFIIQSSGRTFDRDRYAQFLQLDLSLIENRLSFFPGFYAFRRVGNIPDGKETFTLDYNIVHLGSEISILNKPKFRLGIEYYTNIEDYSNSGTVVSELQDQTQGLVLTAKLGELNKKGDWQVSLYYARLQRFAVVDYFAQNDWVRWDYSSEGASGSRITNFQGFELRVGYLIKENFNLILRAYMVESLVSLEDEFMERGNRVRLDLNIKF